jgi:hypothetical protein
LTLPIVAGNDLEPNEVGPQITSCGDKGFKSDQRVNRGNGSASSCLQGHGNRNRAWRHLKLTRRYSHSRPLVCTWCPRRTRPIRMRTRRPAHRRRPYPHSCPCARSWWSPRPCPRQRFLPRSDHRRSPSFFLASVFIR